MFTHEGAARLAEALAEAQAEEEAEALAEAQAEAEAEAEAEVQAQEEVQAEAEAVDAAEAQAQERTEARRVLAALRIEYSNARREHGIASRKCRAQEGFEEHYTNKRPRRAAVEEWATRGAELSAPVFKALRVVDAVSRKLEDAKAVLAAV
jgi:hypothetical protein